MGMGRNGKWRNNIFNSSIPRTHTIGTMVDNLQILFTQQASTVYDYNSAWHHYCCQAGVDALERAWDKLSPDMKKRIANVYHKKSGDR